MMANGMDRIRRHIALSRGGVWPLLIVLACAGFMIAQGYWLLGRDVQATPDSAAFREMARDHSVLSRNFLAGPRPPIMPLLLKCLGGSDRLLVAFQWVVHIGAWGALAALFIRGARSRILGFGFALWILLLALMPQVQIWNPYILSESLALSLLPLVFVSLPRLRSGAGLRADMPLIAVLICGGG